MGARITIVDYGMGNLRSVEKALERVGAEPEISSSAAAIGGADGVVLPGVGAFPHAMVRIDELGLAGAIRAAASSGRPLLGVCLGMQLLFNSSEEHGGAAGLGLLPGAVGRLSAAGLKLPHIGWSPLTVERGSALSEGIDSGEPFYFVHSYAPAPAAEHLLASATHGGSFAAVVGRHPVYGVQFHPEKSSSAGLRMLSNFASICAAVGAGA